jgi:hypothetical protein
LGRGATFYMGITLPGLLLKVPYSSYRSEKPSPRHMGVTHRGNMTGVAGGTLQGLWIMKGWQWEREWT